MNATITVTADDITRGQLTPIGPGRSSACPIAVAVRRAFPRVKVRVTGWFLYLSREAHGAEVTWEHIFDEHVVRFAYFADLALTTKPPKPKKGRQEKPLLPMFEAPTRKLEPISFDLPDLPDWVNE